MMKNSGQFSGAHLSGGNIIGIGRGTGSIPTQPGGKTQSERLDKPSSFVMPNLSVIDGETNSSSSSS
jgi:hypothetical protein